MNIKPIALFVGATISSQALALDEPIVITATRTAQTVDQSLASVTIITSEDIKASQAKSVHELINGHIGIDSTNRGGYGKSGSLFMRGTNTGHVLVLVDGKQIGSATLGEVELQYIHLSQVERIEIVRGPRSSLYGSEAVGGVIQIFTRQGQSGQQIHVDIGVGSNNLRQGALSTSGSHNNSRHSVTVSGLSDDGFDSVDDGEDDDDGYKNQSASLRLGHTFANGLDIDGHLMTAQGESNFDGISQNESEFVQQSAGLNLAFPITENWYSKLSIGNSKDETDNLLNGVFASSFATKRQQASWQNDITLSDALALNIGIDHQTDKIETATTYAVTERENLGVFGQFQGQVAEHDYLLSLRSDDNDSYGQQTTGSLAWGYHVHKDTRLMASYGTAFKAPSFNDLYYPLDDWGSVGNPDLEAEESKSIEIGVRQNFKTGSLEINAYQTKIDNLIDWQPDNTGAWTPQNVSEAKINGLELRYMTQLFGWNSTAEVSWVDPRDTDTDKVLQLRVQESARIEMKKGFGKAELSISATTHGKRYTNATNTNELGGYNLLNIAGKYTLSKQWSLHGRVQNLTDREYSTAQNFSAQDYNSAGRTFFVGVAYDIAR